MFHLEKLFGKYYLLGVLENSNNKVVSPYPISFSALTTGGVSSMEVFINSYLEKVYSWKEFTGNPDNQKDHMS